MLSPMTHPKNASELEHLMRSAIPLARAMDIRVSGYDGQRLVLAAPLAPNVNDKGCAFGGSLGALMTLAGWGLMQLKLAEGGAEADVYVRESSERFLTPVWGPLHAEAWADGEPWAVLISELGVAGKARVELKAEVVAEDGASVAVRQTAGFVAVARGSDG